MEIWAKALESGYGLEEREVAALSFVPDAIGLPPFAPGPGERNGKSVVGILCRGSNPRL